MVVVAAVPLVPVVEVLVIIVPDVSVEVPDGIAEVDVMLVSVLIVPVVPVMLVSVDIVELVVVAPVSVIVVPLVSVVVLFVFVSFLQAKLKTASATTVRRTRTFFVM